MTPAGNSAGAPGWGAENPWREPPRPRPLVVPAIALMVGVWVSEQIGEVGRGTLVVSLAAPCVLLVVLLLGRSWFAPRRVWLVVLVAAMAAVVGFHRHQSVTQRPANHVGRWAGDEPVLTRVTGRVVVSPIERPPVKLNPFLAFDPPARTQFVVSLETLDTTEPATPVVGHVRVSVEGTGLGIRLGQRVQLTGKVWRPFGPQNPGEMDWSRWYRHQGIDAGMSIEGAVHVVVRSAPRLWWARVAETSRGAARGLLFEPYADVEADPALRLLDTMVLGQRRSVDAKINDAFLRAGGMHFLAVSGFNVNLLAGATWWVVRRVARRSARAAGVATVATILLFAIVTEPNAPVLRAAVAGVLAVAAVVWHRPLCLVNWLAAAAIFVLLCNPLELFRAGFQLSFVLVLGLVVLGRWLGDWFPPRVSEGMMPVDAATLGELARSRVWAVVKGLCVVSVWAWLVSVPLCLWHFGRVAPWGWLGSVVLTPWVTVVTLLGFATLVVNMVATPVGAALGSVLHAATSGLLAAVGVFERLPASLIECPTPPIWLVVGTYAIWGLMAWGRGAREAESGDSRASLPSPSPSSPRRVCDLKGRGVWFDRIRWRCGVGVVVVWAGWLAWVMLPGFSGARVGKAVAECRVWVLAVGNGNAVLLTTPGGEGIVLDVGTDTNSDAGATMAAAARSVGCRRVAGVLISHANFDHFSGLPTLARQVPVDRWWTTTYYPRHEAQRAEEARLSRYLPGGFPPAGFLRAGERLNLDGVELEVLWPPDDLGDRWKANDTAMVVRAIVGGQAVLVAGDIERAALAELLARERSGQVDLRAEVLVAPHHGQVIEGVTAEFLAAVSPEVVVVSTRTPRPKLVEAVSGTLGPLARVVETGKVGAVGVGLAGRGRVVVETAYGGGAGGGVGGGFTGERRSGLMRSGGGA